MFWTLASARTPLATASQPRADRTPGHRAEVVEHLDEHAQLLQGAQRRAGAFGIHALVELEPHERRADCAGQADRLDHVGQRARLEHPAYDGLDLCAPQLERVASRWAPAISCAITVTLPVVLSRSWIS